MSTTRCSNWVTSERDMGNAQARSKVLRRCGLAHSSELMHPRGFASESQRTCRSILHCSTKPLTGCSTDAMNWENEKTPSSPWRGRGSNRIWSNAHYFVGPQSRDRRCQQRAFAVVTTFATGNLCSINPHATRGDETDPLSLQADPEHPRRAWETIGRAYGHSQRPPDAQT